MTANGVVTVPAGLAEALAGPPIVGASCAGLSPLWDLDVLPGESAADRTQRVVVAERVCAGCPGRFRCAELAEATPHLTGVVQAGRARGSLPVTGRGAS